MGLIPERKEYKNFTYEKYSLFIDKVQTLGYTKVTHTPTSQKSHLDRYGYLDKGKKVAVVYDLKAKMLTLTAPDKSIKALNSLIKELDGKQKSNKKESADKNPKRAEQPIKENKLGKQNAKEKIKDRKKEENLSSKQNEKSKKEKSKRDQGFFEKKEEKKQNKAVRETEKNKKQNAKKVKDETKKAKKEKLKDNIKEKRNVEIQAVEDKTKETYQNFQSPFVLINQYYPLSFTKAMHRIRNTAEVKINTLPTKNVHKENETANYIIVMGGKNSEVAYMPNLGKLEILGDLTAILKDKYLEFGGVEVASSDLKKESKYEQLLSKLIPTALQFLSAQEINDIGSGYDELKKAKDHYEYSMFLLSPFKGLENFIFDLQKKMGISVKLLGQAYDKDKYGNYVLKEVYQNRCGVVLSEVMVSLYTEYYSKRNFYTHSGDGKEHRISQKNQALMLVEELLYCIEYNCKKLSEISFSIK